MVFASVYFDEDGCGDVVVMSCARASKLEVPQVFVLLVCCTCLSRQQSIIRDTVLQQLTVSRPSLTTS